MLPEEKHCTIGSIRYTLWILENTAWRRPRSSHTFESHRLQLRKWHKNAKNISWKYYTKI